MNDDNAHVCCTNCLYFRLCDEQLPYCMYENKCNINNYKDSMHIQKRPHYKSKNKRSMLK